MVLEWQRSGGSEPDLVMSTPGVCGTEMPASDSPYYKENKVLFDAHVQWIQRHMPGYFSPWLPPNKCTKWLTTFVTISQIYGSLRVVCFLLLSLFLSSSVLLQSCSLFIYNYLMHIYFLQKHWLLIVMGFLLLSM